MQPFTLSPLSRHRPRCERAVRGVFTAWLGLTLLGACSEPETPTPPESNSGAPHSAVSSTTGPGTATSGTEGVAPTAGDTATPTASATTESSSNAVSTSGGSASASGSGGVDGAGTLAGTGTVGDTVGSTTSTGGADSVSASSGATSATSTDGAIGASDSAATGSSTGGFVDDGRGPHAPAEGDIIVLYDGNGFAAWEPVDGATSAVNWHENPDEGYMEIAPTGSNHIVTNAEHLHADVFLHIEFWSPNEGQDQTGQNRGNSGVYLQSRYEQQVLDSFGRPAEIDGCGAIYQVSPPLLNACNPAEQWNVYEIDFTAPRFEDGMKVANARITTWLNDQLVQDDVEVPGPTQAGVAGEVEGPQPLYLQDHGDTVRYRNIWWIHK